MSYRVEVRCQNGHVLNCNGSLLLCTPGQDEKTEHKGKVFAVIFGQGEYEAWAGECKPIEVIHHAAKAKAEEKSDVYDFTIYSPEHDWMLNAKGNAKFCTFCNTWGKA